MRLISDFHDYYDSCITTVDPLHVYKRKTSERIFEHRMGSMFDFPESACFYSLPNQGVIVGFCGELYTCLAFDVTDIGGNTHIPIKKPVYWTLEKYLENNVPNDRKLRDLKNLFNFKPKESLKSLFLEYKTPCFILERAFSHKQTKLTINPRLKDYEFAKVVDPWTAYQAITMFIGNTLVNDNNSTVGLDDTTLRDKHGFDDKSFKRSSKKILT